MSPVTDLSVSRSARRSTLPSVVVSVLFGTAAGAVGTLLVLAYVAPDFSAYAPFSIHGDAGRQVQTEYPSDTAIDAARRAAVSLVVTRPQTGVVGAAYAPGETVAAGLVLTSDGWLVTTSEIGATGQKDAKTMYSAVIAGRAYPVRRVIVDPYSGVRFLKVDATNLSVVAFATDDASVGDQLYTVDAAGGISGQTVRLAGLIPAGADEGLVRNVQELQQALFVGDRAMTLGSVVMNGKGEIVGLAGADGLFGQMVVPVASFARVTGAVLRGGSPVRPVLGLNYIDLSSTKVSADSPSRGALVAASPDGLRPALLRRGPAEVAGIHAGDIITSFDDEQVNAGRTLSEILADHSPGDTVQITLLRGKVGQEMTVNAVLGASASASTTP